MRQMHKELGFRWFIFPSACFASPPSNRWSPSLLELPASFLWLHLLEMPLGGLRAKLRKWGKRCPKEECRTNRVDGIRGQREEKGGKAPASLPASSSESSAPGWPTLQTGSHLPACIIVSVHIVLCMNPCEVKNRHDAPRHCPIYKDKDIYIYICMYVYIYIYIHLKLC